MYITMDIWCQYQYLPKIFYCSLYTFLQRHKSIRSINTDSLFYTAPWLISTNIELFPMIDKVGTVPWATDKIQQRTWEHVLYWYNCLYLVRIVRPTATLKIRHYIVVCPTDSKLYLRLIVARVISKNQTILRIITGNFRWLSLILNNFPSGKTCLFLIYCRHAVDTVERRWL